MAAKKTKSSFGPGFLVTAAFIGPGTVTACSMAGARFGYALIFTLVFATFTALFLQGMTGRLALGSGMDLAQALRAFPKKKMSRFFFIILTLSSITFGCAAYEAGNIIGGSLGLEMVTSVPKKVWVLLIACCAVFILSLQRYKWVEKFLIFLVFLMSGSFVTTMIIVRPNPVSILKGFIPSLPPDSLYLVLALIGTTVVPYNLFLHSAAVRQKWTSPSDMRTIWKDLFISIGLGGLISISIIITSAVAFHEKGISLESGAQLARQLKPLFQSRADILFGFGFFAAGLSSALTAPYAAAFASSGVLGWKNGQRSFGFKAVWLGVIISGVIISFFDFNPLAVIVFAQAANGIILPVASIFLLIVLNNRRNMGALTNRLQQNILGGIIILIVSALGLWSIFKLFL
ncbi:MAG: Nramp family divalent metal transporter [Candidatus Aminicenantes bacterium]|nr:Nramp family divalent metal transporter [Candidatus Aminicenantes bacterium]